MTHRQRNGSCSKKALSNSWPCVADATLSLFTYSNYVVVSHAIASSTYLESWRCLLDEQRPSANPHNSCCFLDCTRRSSYSAFMSFAFKPSAADARFSWRVLGIPVSQSHVTRRAAPLIGQSAARLIAYSYRPSPPIAPPPYFNRLKAKTSRLSRKRVILIHKNKNSPYSPNHSTETESIIFALLTAFKSIFFLRTCDSVYACVLRFIRWQAETIQKIL